MQRIDSKYAVSKLPEPGKAETDPGYFTGGNTEAETPGTALSADWFNMVQEEIMAVVEAANQMPDKDKRDQLLTGIKKIIDDDPKSNSAVNAAQAAAKVADEAARVSREATTSIDSAVKTANNAEGISRAAEVKADTAVKTAESAEGISRAAEAKADSALTHTGQNTGTFWINDEPLDANNFFSNAVNYYLTNAENQNLPIAAPLYFKAEINADPADVGSPTSVIQTAWNTADSFWRRMGAVGQNGEGAPAVTWGGWKKFTPGNGTLDISQQIMIVHDLRVSGEAGGTYTAGAWQTRRLTNMAITTISDANLNGSQIFLPPGTYLIEASAIFYRTGCSLISLFDVGANKILFTGLTGYSSPTQGDTQVAIVSAVCTFPTGTTLELRFKGDNTSEITGFGIPHKWLEYYNRYAEIVIRKLS